jgi:uncharacterized protein (DUF1778 family)
MALSLKPKRPASKSASKSSGRRSSTLQIRIARDDKELVQQAADLSGVSLSEFVVATMRARAQDAIMDRRVYVMSPAGFDAFMALARNPPKLSRAGKARFARKRVWE